MKPQGGRLEAVAIRPTLLHDLPGLLAIENDAFPGDRLDRRAFRHAVASPTILAQTAVDGEGRPLGYALVQIRRGSRIAWLTSVAVAKSALGRGLGRTLVEAAETAARKAGRDRLRLEVRADNAPAIRLYERDGYRRAGRVDNYYEDGEAALRYEKDLVEAGAKRPG